MKYHPTPLTEAERDTAVSAIERDGFTILPRQLDPDLIACGAAAVREAAATANGPFRCDDLLPRAAAFREIATVPAILQVALDLLGPTLQLVHSNLFWRPASEPNSTLDYLAATPWHSDGPPEAPHPRVHGIPALISLKVGVFLSDVASLDDGPLQVIRGSHRCAPSTNDDHVSEQFVANHTEAITTLLVPAGSLVLFHLSTWHAAPPVRSTKPRINCYFNYGPLWLNTWDRAPCQPAPADWTPQAQALQRGASSQRATQHAGPLELAPFAELRRGTTRAGTVYR